MARIAERVLGEAKASGRRLGKEVLDYFMHIFTEIADAERAAALAERPENAREHEERFERFARYAIDCAHKLAPYYWGACLINTPVAEEYIFRGMLPLGTLQNAS